MHHQFLAEDDNDPRKEFIESLCKVVKWAGNIVVYSQSFESSRLSDLARWVPKFAHKIAQMQNRLWDLLPVIRKHVYHPQFGGSFSLKRVLPALIPGMTYEGMSVSEGSEAGLAWEKMIRGNDGVEKERLKEGLLAYCRQDTLAMVKLVERLQRE